MKHKAVITVEVDSGEEEINISCTFDPEFNKNDIKSNKAAPIAMMMLHLLKADAEGEK